MSSECTQARRLDKKIVGTQRVLANEIVQKSASLETHVESLKELTRIVEQNATVVHFLHNERETEENKQIAHAAKSDELQALNNARLKLMQIKKVACELENVIAVKRHLYQLKRERGK